MAIMRLCLPLLLLQQQQQQQQQQHQQQHQQQQQSVYPILPKWPSGGFIPFCLWDAGTIPLIQDEDRRRAMLSSL